MSCSKTKKLEIDSDSKSGSGTERVKSLWKTVVIHSLLEKFSATGTACCSLELSKLQA